MLFFFAGLCSHNIGPFQLYKMLDTHGLISRASAAVGEGTWEIAPHLMPATQRRAEEVASSGAFSSSALTARNHTVR
jgi:hypothetical protein